MINYFSKLVLISAFFVVICGVHTSYSEKTIDYNKLNYSIGKIDRIGTGEIVIDDTLYRFSENVLFLSKYGSKVPYRTFKTGQKVKFYLNKESLLLVLRKT